MSKRSFFRTLMTACLLALPMVAWGTSGPPSTVSVSAVVDTFAEWSDTAPALAIGTHITAVAQEQTAQLDLHLYTNVDTTIQPSAGANSGILTNSTAPAPTETLTTSYQLIGAGLDVPDGVGVYKLAGTGAGQFFESPGNAHHVTYVPGTGTYAISLGVKAVSNSATSAPKHGTYTCEVILTATW